MRDYGMVTHRWWTGTTGKAIRALKDDHERHLVRSVGVYLLTGSMSNMIGLYYLPIPLLCHEVGTPLEGAMKALQSLESLGFSLYDHETETVWVVEMAREQIGESLSVTDNQVKAVIKEWQKYRKSRFFKEFHAKYGAAFHLPSLTKEASPSEAPSKPLRSQEQEQEQKQEQEKGAANQPVEEKPATDFDLTAAGLSTAWCFYLKRSRNRAKADDPADVTTFFDELLRLGASPAELMADINDPKRDRTEHLWQFKRRFEQRSKAAPASAATMTNEQIAANVKAQRERIDATFRS